MGHYTIFTPCHVRKLVLKRRIMFDADIALLFKRFAVAAVPALLGIILHEVAHGWVAFKRGDPTARLMGRLTLNPVPHIDPMGLLVFAMTSLSGAFVFGWAKPVPVNPRYFKDPQKDMMLVSLAGPLTNLCLAFVFALFLRVLLEFFPFMQWQDSATYIFFLLMLQTGVVINVGLCWLNLLPIPPLDGSKVVAFFLPNHLAWPYMSAGKYGFLILILLMVTGALGLILGPIVGATNDIILTTFGLK